MSQGTIIERPIAALDGIKINKSKQFDIIDLIRAKPFPKELKNILSKYNSIITIDEQTSTGSLESLIKENISSKILFHLSLPDQFIFQNMGRDNVGIDIGYNDLFSSIDGAISNIIIIKGNKISRYILISRWISRIKL